MEISKQKFIEFLNKNGIDTSFLYWFDEKNVLSEIINRFNIILKEQNMTIDEVKLKQGLENVVFIFNNKVFKVSKGYCQDFPYIPDHPLILQPLYKKLIPSQVRNGLNFYMMEFEKIMVFENITDPSYIKYSEVWELKKSLLSYGINWCDCHIRNLGIKDGKLIIVDTGYIKNMTCYKISKRKLTWLEKKFFGIYSILKKVEKKIACYKKIEEEYNKAIKDNRTEFLDRIQHSAESDTRTKQDIYYDELYYLIFKKIMSSDLEYFK